MSCARPTAGARVALVNLGCRVNRVELDGIALRLQELGCVLVGQHDADVVVVNTCAVTGEAQAKTRKAVRHATGLPRAPHVVATGCVASLFADELADLGPRVVVEADKAKVPDRVVAALEWRVSVASETKAEGAPGGKAEGALPVRTTPTGRTRPGIKIQDGCDNRCTFCIVWKARGRSRSKAYGDVLAEVRAAQARGAHEVVLTGINLGNYRDDEEPKASHGLPWLLARLLEDTTVERIRLSSIEPPDVDGELLCVMAAAGPRIAPFLHVCLQAGCDRTLRAMGRVYDVATFARTCEAARAALPDLALGTDLIVGFPGETDDDFAASLAFCEEMGFAKMHVFRYSRRPGTPAAARADQCAPQTIAARSAQALELAERLRFEQAGRRVGARELVCVQYPGRGVSGGLFDVLVDEDEPLDALMSVRIRAVLPDGTLDARTAGA